MKYITIYHASGKKSDAGNKIVYTTGEQIYRHGYREYWRDNDTNSLASTNYFDRGEMIGIHKNYMEDGKLQDWYHFPTLIDGIHTTYEYTYSAGKPVTITRFHTVKRTSIHDGWVWTGISTTITPGWEPPANTLPPAGQ